MSKRLTYHDPDGSFGVVNMTDRNRYEKLYACVCKLKDYEDSGKTPEECRAPDLCIGAELPNGYTVDANYGNRWILAHMDTNAPGTADWITRKHAVCALTPAGDTYQWSYFDDAEEAQRWYAYMCFDWYNQEVQSGQTIEWKDYRSHRTARYNGWLLLIDVKAGEDNIIKLYLPDDCWDDPEVISDYNEVTSYEPEWEVDNEDQAVEYIEDY